METDVIIDIEIIVFVAIGCVMMVIVGVALIKETWFKKGKNE